MNDKPSQVSVRVTGGDFTFDRTYLVYMTNAPRVYEGFGTISIASYPEQRLVMIDREHLDWQMNRYASGGYWALPEGRLDSWLAEKTVEHLQTLTVPE